MVASRHTFRGRGPRTTPTFLQNQDNQYNGFYKPFATVSQGPRDFSLCDLCNAKSCGIPDAALQAMYGLPFRPQRATLVHK